MHSGILKSGQSHQETRKAHKLEPGKQELQGGPILMAKQTWDIGRLIFFSVTYSAYKRHSLEVCKYNFTEGDADVIQNPYIGCRWRRGSSFLTSMSK